MYWFEQSFTGLIWARGPLLIVRTASWQMRTSSTVKSKQKYSQTCI